MKKKVFKGIQSLISSQKVEGIKERAKARSERLIETGLYKVKKVRQKIKSKIYSSLTNEDLDQLIHLVEEEGESSTNPKYFKELKNKLESLKE